MTEKAWEEVRDLIMIPDLEEPLFSQMDNPIYTVEWLIRNNLQEHKDEILEIALKAAKEADLRK